MYSPNSKLPKLILSIIHIPPPFFFFLGEEEAFRPLRASNYSLGVYNSRFHIHPKLLNGGIPYVPFGT